MSLLRRRMMMQNMEEGEEMEKEWKLLDILDFSVDKGKTYNVNGVTEIFLQGNLLKCEKDVASNTEMMVNRKKIGAFLSTDKQSSQGKYQHLHAKWNGLFWEIRQSAAALSKENTTMNYQNSNYPYNVIMNVGKATELYFCAASPSNYPVEGGTIEIYIRQKVIN